MGDLLYDWRVCPARESNSLPKWRVGSSMKEYVVLLPLLPLVWAGEFSKAGAGISLYYGGTSFMMGRVGPARESNSLPKWRVGSSMIWFGHWDFQNIASSYYVSPDELIWFNSQRPPLAPIESVGAFKTGMFRPIAPIVSRPIDFVGVDKTGIFWPIAPIIQVQGHLPPPEAPPLPLAVRPHRHVRVHRAKSTQVTNVISRVTRFFEQKKAQVFGKMSDKKRLKSQLIRLVELFRFGFLLICFG